MVELELLRFARFKRFDRLWKRSLVSMMTKGFSAPQDFRIMEAVCLEWLNTVTVESSWLTEEPYREK